MAVEYPGVKIAIDEDEVSMDIIFHNKGKSDETVNVWIAEKPAEWKARIKTYRYSITDGGALDGDGAVDGNMDDPSAPGVTDLGGPPINEIPTLDEWARWSLVLMLILLGWWMLGLRLRR